MGLVSISPSFNIPCNLHEQVTDRELLYSAEDGKDLLCISQGWYGQYGRAS
jgi:hypothetical protein